MLQDFLEVNKLNGKIISFPSDISIEKAAEANHISKNSIARTFVFVDKKMDFYSVIAQKDEVVSAKDAACLYSEPSLEDASEKDVFRILGEQKAFLPPVGVMGVKALLHSSVKGQKNLLFQLSPREFLLIQPADILKSKELEEGFV